MKDQIPSLDTAFVRAQFPAFSEPSLEGQAFFENAGGSYMCRQVFDRLSRYCVARKVQPYGAFPASRVAGEEMDAARTRLAALLGVEANELSFGPSTTQNTYVLSHALGEWMKRGEAIVVTNQDHEANSGPWRRLEANGIEVREWKINAETGRLDPEDLEPLLDESVRLVCFPHASNVVGEINPVIEITAMAHAAGAFVCVDGVSYAPHGLPNVGGMGPDIYLFSSYKTFGPHQGIMVIRKALAELLPNQAHFFNGDTLYKKFTPAGPDHAQVAACAGMVDYVDLLHDHHGGTETALKRRAEFVHDLQRTHETEILAPLLAMLADRADIRLIGPTDATLRAPTVAFAPKRPAEQIAADLAGRGIMAGAGDFYAVRPLQAMGIDPKDGVVRLSLVHYNTAEEVAKLIAALDDIL